MPLEPLILCVYGGGGGGGEARLECLSRNENCGINKITLKSLLYGRKQCILYTCVKTTHTHTHTHRTHQNVLEK